MAVIEYKLHIVGHSGQQQQPMWVRKGGHFPNPDDHTYVGWALDNASYYIPDTVVNLTKEQLVQRQLSIHQKYPEQESVYIGEETESEAQQQDVENWTLRDKTEEKVREEVENWYEWYVNHEVQGILK